METQIAPMLAVSDGQAAIAFYKAAFGAELLWRLGDGHVVAGLSVGGAQFFLAHESPDYGTRSPDSAGFTTVRIELFVDDPKAVQQRALDAGGDRAQRRRRTPPRNARTVPDQAHVARPCRGPLRPYVARREVPRVAFAPQSLLRRDDLFLEPTRCSEEKQSAHDCQH